MKHITTQDALQALEEAVAEKGEDYVYPYSQKIGDEWQTCRYLEDDRTPSCIVGHALVRLGVDPDAIWPHNTDHDASELASVLNLPIADVAVQAMWEAQSYQDLGRPWGEALKAAREEASDA